MRAAVVSCFGLRSFSMVSAVSAVLVLLVGCGGSAVDVPGSAGNGSSPSDDAGGAPATSATGSPSAPDTPSGPSAVSSDDGSATRVACTSSFGSAITKTHGRLDGYLVAVVPETTRSCNSDGQHVHLQVKTGGSVYDIAVNVDGFEAETDGPLPGAAWAEGWHPGEQLDYVKNLNLHASSFTLTGLAAVRKQVENAVANANHVAIYATGYGPTGVHLVHRQGSGRDGAVVIDPLGPKPHVLAFRFDTQSF